MKVVAEFKAGDAVPSWLFDQEPNGPDSEMGKMFFAKNVSIVESETSYWVLSDDIIGTRDTLTIIGNGMNHCRIFASAKNVVMPTAFQCVFSL